MACCKKAAAQFKAGLFHTRNWEARGFPAVSRVALWRQRRAVSGQSTTDFQLPHFLHLSYILGSFFLQKTELRLQEKRAENLNLEEVLAKQTTMSIRSERQGEDKMGEWIMKLVRSRVKNRKGCGISQGSRSGLYPPKRMPIVEWVRLLKGAAMGSFTQKHSIAEVLPYNTLLKVPKAPISYLSSSLDYFTHITNQFSTKQPMWTIRKVRQSLLSDSNFPMAFPWHLNKILNLYGGPNLSCPSLITTLLLIHTPQCPGCFLTKLLANLCWAVSLPTCPAVSCSEDTSSKSPFLFKVI